MPRRERTDDRHAILYAREDLPRPAAKRRDAVAARLEAVADGGSLDAFDVVHWEKRVPAAGAPVREETLTEEFREWAAANDARLAPCFETRRCYDDSGEKRTELVLPVLCLAVYEGGQLREVTPHGTGGDVVTVTDCLERLEAGTFEATDDGEMMTTAD